MLKKLLYLLLLPALLLTACKEEEKPEPKPDPEFVHGSSSTLVFGWTTGGTAAEDAEVPYRIELFRDAACTDLQVSFEIEKGHDCWASKPLRFVFGGLQPETSYWFRVTNTETGEVSNVVSGQTTAFTVVDPTTVSNAAAGDVILAEDFSEISWGPDELSSAAGFVPSPKNLNVPSGENPTGSFTSYDNTDNRIFGTNVHLDDSRLSKGWGFFGNSSTFLRNAYLRVGESGGRTHMVTPPLSGIPEGKLATVEVTVTATKYDSGIQLAVFAEKGLTMDYTTDPGNSSYKKYTGASLANGVAFDISTTKDFVTETAILENVDSECQLLIGSLEDNVVSGTSKNRFYLSDVTVKIVSIEETPELPDVQASLGKATSCSLTFTWTEGVSAADDIAKPWTIALYRDAACTDLVVSHNIDADSGKWSDLQPRFIFGGLDPATDYWFKATDTTEGAEKSSDVIKATTTSFTRVDASTVSDAAVGDIILAEDFSETYGPDEWDKAAGFMPSSSTRNLNPPSGEDPEGFIENYTSTGTRFWGNSVQMTPGRRLANGWGFFGNSAVYSRTGYFRVATTSGRTHIVTPKLSGIPNGHKATLSITVTALLHEKASNVDVAVFAESGLTMNSTADVTNASYCKYTGASLSNGHALGLANTTQKKWYTKTVTIEGVSNQDHLIIGSLNNVSSKNRFNIADIVVKIIAMEDPNRTVKVSILGDSISTYAGWCDTTKGGAYYPKSGCDVDDVSKTWWYRLIYDKMSYGKFEKNISAGNTTVVQNTTGDSGAYWYGWDFGTRLQQKGLGDPDVVFIHGGTNDYGHTLYNNASEELIDGLAMSSKTFPDSFKSDLADLLEEGDLATSVDEADALDGKTFASAYIRLIRMLKTRYPSVKIVCVIGDYVQLGMGEAIRLIADHYDYVRVADLLGEYGFHANSSTGIPKFDYAHPNAAGMSVMANYIYSQVGSWIDVQ
ncbi:MAG: SGNH/GDSL hydrolase family protein [Bacteroidales bacterium]|nr:SGNH/GDSL hydrolase family protein [Bacteroidales bacterium]